MFAINSATFAICSGIGIAIGVATHSVGWAAFAMGVAGFVCVAIGLSVVIAGGAVPVILKQMRGRKSQKSN